MMLELTEITHFCVHHFKSFNRVKSIQDDKVRFKKRNELILVQVELISLLFLE